jgi:hypothetical protein
LLFSGCKLTRSACDFPYRRHHLIGGRLLDHVAVAGYPVKTALNDAGVKPGRLSVDINQLVLLAIDPSNRSLKTLQLANGHSSRPADGSCGVSVQIVDSIGH